MIAALAYVAVRGARAAAADAASGAVGAVVGMGEGIVVGVGDAIGVPRTNETECEKAKREGRTLDASFACPAGDFISWLWGK